MLDEASLKALLEICGRFCVQRCKLQSELLADRHEDDRLRELFSDLKLRQCVDNFLSTEYVELMLEAIVRSAEQKFALSVQYEANEVLSSGREQRGSIFSFSSRFLFTDNQQQLEHTLVNEQSRRLFVLALNSDVAQLSAYMISSCFYAREACLQSLAVLVNERSSSSGCKRILNSLLHTNVHADLVHALTLACYDPEGKIGLFHELIRTACQNSSSFCFVNKIFNAKKQISIYRE